MASAIVGVVAGVALGLGLGANPNTLNAWLRACYDAVTAARTLV